MSNVWHLTFQELQRNQIDQNDKEISQGTGFNG